MYPPMLSPVAAFLAGAVFDLITGGIFGLTALTLVVAQWVTRSQRKFLMGQPFLVMWVGLGLVALGANALQWALGSLFNWSLMPVESALMSALLTTAIFPIAVLPLSVFNKPLADRNSSL
jgi:rod shape-determining protein MreD